MKTRTRLLIVSLAATLVPALVACDKGELKEDVTPKSGPSSAAANGPAGDKKADTKKSDDKMDDKKPAEGVTVDHSKLDGVLKKFVNDKGRVNYKGLKADADSVKMLDDYRAWVGTADISKMSKDQQLAFYINAYNAHTMKAVIDRYPLKSVLDVKDPDFFKGAMHKVAGEEITLDVLENKKIREGFSEARIHFVVNCASTSCPVLRRDALTAANLEANLEAGAKHYVTQETKIDAGKKTIDTSNIFNWFKDDFIKSSGSVQAFLAKYIEGTEADAIKDHTLTFHEYDWTLNEAK
jgi:hypothetical protein